MTAPAFKEIVLDYADVGATPELLDHLSTLACAGEFLWCASDEGRTIECRRFHGDRRRKIHRALWGSWPRSLPRECAREWSLRFRRRDGGRSQCSNIPFVSAVWSGA